MLDGWPKLPVEGKILKPLLGNNFTGDGRGRLCNVERSGNKPNGASLAINSIITPLPFKHTWAPKSETSNCSCNHLGSTSIALSTVIGLCCFCE